MIRRTLFATGTFRRGARLLTEAMKMTTFKRIFPIALCFGSILFLTGWFETGSQVLNQSYHCNSKAGDYILTNTETKQEKRLPVDSSQRELNLARAEGFTTQRNERIWSCSFSYLDSQLIGQNHTIVEDTIDPTSRYDFDALISMHNRCRAQHDDNENHKIPVFSGTAVVGDKIKIIGLACFSRNMVGLDQYKEPPQEKDTESSS